MKKLFSLIILFPSILQSQNINVRNDGGIKLSGVKWVKETQWSQIKERAKNENKYIFVDCYATWCGPCKRMDDVVYSDKKIGSLINSKFISTRVQFDKTSGDDEYVRSCYDIADNLNEKYKITAYPTFLFFSPDGEIVHRDIGYKNVDQFISTINTALDPQMQFYHLLSEYKEGRRELGVMKKLALDCKMYGNDKLALQIAEDYLKSIDRRTVLNIEGFQFLKTFQNSGVVQKIIKEYKGECLDKMNESELLNITYLSFIVRFPYLLKSNDNLFKLLYNYSGKADSVVNNVGFSNEIVCRVIRDEEINSVLYSDINIPKVKKPNWDSIKKCIISKYKMSYVEELLPVAQLNFYKNIDNWKMFVRIMDNRIKQLPLTREGKNLHPYGNVWGLNVAAWDLFLHCNETKILKRALYWSELSIKLDGPNPNVQCLDTRANILYKLGKVDDAIVQEKKAIEIDNANGYRKGRERGIFYDEFNSKLYKMNHHEPTWKLE